MTVQTLDSHQARLRWRDMLDAAHTGSDVIIERYGKPMATLIPYEDYQALLDELDDLREARRATAAYEAWKREPSLGRPYEEIRAELMAEGLLDTNEESNENDERSQASVEDHLPAAT